MGAGRVESGGPRACRAQHTWLYVLQALGCSQELCCCGPRNARLAQQGHQTHCGLAAFSLRPPRRPDNWTVFLVLFLLKTVSVSSPGVRKGNQRQSWHLFQCLPSLRGWEQLQLHGVFLTGWGQFILRLKLLGPGLHYYPLVTALTLAEFFFIP